MESLVIDFKHILCPVDFSDSSARSLNHVAALARWYEAQLTVMHVVPTFGPVQGPSDFGAPVRFVSPMTREEVLAEMCRVLDLAHVPPDSTLTAQAGDASMRKAAADSCCSISGADCSRVHAHEHRAREVRAAARGLSAPSIQ